MTRLPDHYDMKTREIPRPVPNPGPLPAPWTAWRHSAGVTYATRDATAVVEEVNGLLEIDMNDTPESVTRLLALLEWRRRGGSVPGDGASPLEPLPTYKETS